jgi:hypothetical protein
MGDLAYAPSGLVRVRDKFFRMSPSVPEFVWLLRMPRLSASGIYTRARIRRGLPTSVSFPLRQVLSTGHAFVGACRADDISICKMAIVSKHFASVAELLIPAGQYQGNQLLVALWPSSVRCKPLSEADLKVAEPANNPGCRWSQTDSKVECHDKQ